MQTGIPASKTQRSLPIAALLLGLIGLLELAWVLMENIKASPCGGPLTEHYFSIPSLLGFTLGLLTIASLPSCGFHHGPGREIMAINSLRTIHQNQATYYAICSHFATLEELAAFGLLDAEYACGREISGYVYTSSDVTAETYCAHADRANDKCGRRDFIVCEDGIIRYTESNSRGTVKRDEGTPLSETGGAGPSGRFQK